jgi:general secretion pathway protein G
MYLMKSNKQSGFTIVELLIVIVVIAILAAITIVAYNGIQNRARDTDRKADMAALAKALHLYNVDNGNYVESGSGCGNGGNGSGYALYDYDGATTTLKSIMQCLVDGKYLSAAVTDPTGVESCGSLGTACHTYMKATCTTGSYPGTYLYANLDTLPQTATDTDATCYSAWDTSYGMNYVIKVN